MSDALPTLDAAWAAARDYWSPTLLVRAPCCQEGPAIAWIDLHSRAVHVDAARVVGDGVEGSLEAILAHELGHHVLYPASLQVEARLRLLERQMIPFAGTAMVNLFTDLLINEELGARYAKELAAVYRAATAREPVRDPAFAFYLAIYEELWQLEPGSLRGATPAFDAAHPSHRADAQLVCQNLFSLAPNVFAQFLFFLSVVSRYLKLPDEDDPESVVVFRVLRCGPGEPSPDDWARALVPNAAEREAIERALREGWIDRRLADALRDHDARTSGLPGMERGEAHQTTEIMAAWYRHEAERWLFRPPPARVLGEAIVPTTLEPWEHGDSPGAIDWVASLRNGLPLALTELVQRTSVPEVEGYEAPLWQTKMELYLDVSGSMPDPRRARNPMTLAAQVLAMAAVRAGGWVRALVYSVDLVQSWTFSRSELDLSRFLMHYIGGGTEFPFGILAASVEETRTAAPIRVVLTDRDFDVNFDKHPKAPQVVGEAARRAPFLLLQHHADEERARSYARLGARVIPVGTLDAFPRVAASLAHALFPEVRRGHP